MQKSSCISCKTGITAHGIAAKFNCPSCQAYEIVRCKKCREVAAIYTCPSCGFVGPN